MKFHQASQRESKRHHRSLSVVIGHDTSSSIPKFSQVCPSFPSENALALTASGRKLCLPVVTGIYSKNIFVARVNARALHVQM